MSRCAWTAGAVCLSWMLAACATRPAAPCAAHEVRGQGQPTVVLASGYGMTRDTWKAVADDLSRDFTVFAIDRPGYGGQPDTDRPRDPCTIATETRQALKDAGLPPPYLLVGHSIGGLYQYAFARLYPQDVAGHVLLDPTHPRNWDTIQTTMPMMAKAVSTMVALQPRTALRQEFRQQTDCLDTLAQRPALRGPGRLLVSRRLREVEKDFAQPLQALQADWVQLAGGVDKRVLWDSGHHIQTERPDAVAQAVRAVAGRAPPPAASGATPDLRIPVGARGDVTVVPGQTRQHEVSQRLGTPDETHADGERTIWVYRAPGLRVPTGVGFIPIVGDVFELVELAQKGATRHESVIEFDGQGIVRHARRRPVED